MPPKPPAVPTGTAVERRTQMLRHLMEAMQADAGGTGRFVVDQGKTVHLGLVGIGPPAFMAPRAASQGMPMDGYRMELAQTWCFNQLRVTDEQTRPAAIQAEFLDKAQVRSTLGTYVGDAGYVLGYVALYRLGASPRFSDADVKRARAFDGWIVDVLNAAAVADDVVDICAGQCVFDADGTLLLSSEPTQGPRAQLELARAAREFLAGDRFESSLLGDWRLTMRRMTGGRGDVALVDVRPVWAGRIPPLLELSLIKRRVASYAAEGGTVQDIAARIGRRPETVRAHLRDIYLKLGVASRVELADLCNSVWASEAARPAMHALRPPR